MSAKYTCCVEIWRGFGYYNGECGKPSKVEVYGKHYCGIHNPIKRKEKEDAKRNERLEKQKNREKIFSDNAAAKAEIERRADCYPELLEACQKMTAFFPADLLSTKGKDYQFEAFFDTADALFVMKAIAKALGETK